VNLSDGRFKLNTISSISLDLTNVTVPLIVAPVNALSVPKEDRPDEYVVVGKFD